MEPIECRGSIIYDYLDSSKLNEKDLVAWEAPGSKVNRTKSHNSFLSNKSNNMTTLQLDTYSLRSRI
jgi:hypothetical protein